MWRGEMYHLKGTATWGLMSQQQPKHEKQVEYYVRHAEEKKSLNLEF